MKTCVVFFFSLQNMCLCSPISIQTYAIIVSKIRHRKSPPDKRRGGMGCVCVWGREGGGLDCVTTTPGHAAKRTRRKRHKNVGITWLGCYVNVTSLSIVTSASKPFDGHSRRHPDRRQTEKKNILLVY